MSEPKSKRSRRELPTTKAGAIKWLVKRFPPCVSLEEYADAVDITDFMLEHVVEGHFGALRWGAASLASVVGGS